MKHITKNSGDIVDFDRDKLAKSIYKSFISNHYSAKHSAKYSDTVVAQVHEWLDKKTIITTKDIRALVYKRIETIDPAVALSYKKHKHIW